MKTSLAILGSSIALLGGCDEDTTCTAIAAASVSLQIVDASDGEPVADPDITFTVDGGDPRMPVEVHGESHVLAYEETGVFDVNVAAPGYEPASRTYEIGLDDAQCHVEGVTGEIALEPTTADEA